VVGVVAIAYVKKYKRLIDTMESINDVDNVEITVKKKVASSDTARSGVK
jgi:hypothetical protein